MAPYGSLVKIIYVNTSNHPCLLLKLYDNISKNIRFYSDETKSNDTYVMSFQRTPIGNFNGYLKSLSAVDLATKALRAAIEKSSVPKQDITELIFGCSAIHGMGQSPDRQTLLQAGLPVTTVSTCVNKLCGTGMKAIMLASQLISCNVNDVVAVVGTDSTSNYPYILKRKQSTLGDLILYDVLFEDLVMDPFEKIDVTQFAEITAKEMGYSRAMQDDYALKSYARAAAAQEVGVFKEELVPVTVRINGKEKTIDSDEAINSLNLDNFKTVKPVVEKGTITYANSSKPADGAAAMILASGNYVEKNNLKPLAKIVAYADAAVNPKQFCYSPLVAISKALKKANLDVKAIDLWEINETFAVTPLLNARKLKLHSEKVNTNGGAISLGQPSGMTGVRLVGHLALILKSRKLGCATIQHANGGGCCIVLEKI